jgi:hypothetical protein
MKINSVTRAFPVTGLKSSKSKYQDKKDPCQTPLSLA